MATFQKNLNVNLKTSFNFKLQKIDNVSTKANRNFNYSSVTTCLTNKLETFSMKQANLLRNRRKICQVLREVQQGK